MCAVYLNHSTKAEKEEAHQPRRICVSWLRNWLSQYRQYCGRRPIDHASMRIRDYRVKCSLVSWRRVWGECDVFSCIIYCMVTFGIWNVVIHASVTLLQCQCYFLVLYEPSRPFVALYCDSLLFDISISTAYASCLASSTWIQLNACLYNTSSLAHVTTM